MIASIVQNNLLPIAEACKKYRVKSLYLFGSAVSANFSPSSDLDFMVDYFKDAQGLPEEPFDYFDLLFSLESITGKKNDLAIKEAVRNSYFKKSIEEQKILIYGQRD